MSAVARTHFHEVQRWMEASAGPSNGRGGAATFVQHFGGPLNLSTES